MVKTDTFLQDSLEDLGEKGCLRKLRCLSGSQGREIIIDDQKVLNFCSNNYLGLADDVRLKEAAIVSLEAEGLGSGASRLVCGNLSAHKNLEERIARFKGTDAALVFSTGYMANVGIISSLFGRNDVIFSDKLNHASIIDGILLSQAKFKRYPHVDMKALEGMLQETREKIRKVIITDSVFSMDGDIAPLDKIVALAKKYNCQVMIDEAHALGVLGRIGRGAAEHFGVEEEIDIKMGTLSKAVGSFGAYCCGSRELIDYLINKARSFIYTTGMPPSVAAASLKGIEIIESEPERREKLWDNARYLLRKLKETGFETLRSQTPIIPVLVKESENAVRFSERLFEAGIFISAIRPPTVPAQTARLRLTVMATHTREDVHYLLQHMERIGKELCII